MTQYDILQVDAFTTKPCSGNPAAVVPIPGHEWPADTILQAIANENNLSETAFYLEPVDGVRPLRWLTPEAEVDLCGHATLGCAAAIFVRKEHQGTIRFSTRSGELRVERRGETQLVMDFPCNTPTAVSGSLTAGLISALGVDASNVEQVLQCDDYIVVMKHESDVDQCVPDMKELGKIKTRGIIVTCQGSTHDVRSRFFAPAVGVDEDPVTGSAHTWLAPYWCNRLGKDTITCRQGNSKRGGELTAQLKGDRVELIGSFALYMEGKINV